jgi:hypothetical protein
LSKKPLPKIFVGNTIDSLSHTPHTHPFSLYLFFVYIKECKDQLHWECADEELARARGGKLFGGSGHIEIHVCTTPGTQSSQECWQPQEQSQQTKKKAGNLLAAATQVAGATKARTRLTRDWFVTGT